MWWHDYVFIGNHAQHYSGFTAFLKDLDLRTPALRYFPETEVLQFAPDAPEKLPDFSRPDWPNRVVRSLEPVSPGSKEVAAAPPWPVRRYYSAARHMPGPDSRFDAMTGGSPDMLFGWVFRRDGVYEYPEIPEIYAPASGLAIRLPAMLNPGLWEAVYFDTMTGETVTTCRFRRVNNLDQIMPLPPFLIDTAFKLHRIKGDAK